MREVSDTSSDIDNEHKSRTKRAQVVDLTKLPGQACPCGTARRAFASSEDVPGTIHLTEITRDAIEHYHREHTEVYVILECEDDAYLSLDGEKIDVHPLTSILIPPGVRHCAHGEMRVLIYCTPNFDPDDEHFDERPITTEPSE